MKRSARGHRLVPARSDYRADFQRNRSKQFNRGCFRMPSEAAAISSELDFSPATLYYRAEGLDAKFVADFAIRQQDVTVETLDQVTIHNREASVAQAIDYSVRYVPIERLRLEVPREQLEQHKLKFAILGESLVPQMTPGETAPERAAIELPLPRPMIGAFRLDIAYSIAAPRRIGSPSTSLDLPLAVPGDGIISGNTAEVTASPEIRVEQRDGAWGPIDTAMALVPGVEQPLRLSAAEAVDTLQLQLSRDVNRCRTRLSIARGFKPGSPKRSG